MTAARESEIRRLAGEVIETARQMERSGLVDGTAGNLSVADEARSCVVITPSGIPWPELDAADLCVIGLDEADAGSGGTVLRGAYRPSSELSMHFQVYRARPDVRAVVHTHSRFATTFAVLGRPVRAVHYVLAFAGPRVDVAPYQTYGSDGLGQSCVQALGHRQATLLANHGVLAVGATAAAARSAASAVEYCAELQWRAECIGRPVILDDEEMARVQEKFASYGQPHERLRTGTGSTG
jgi:L-fuculose-phosphate aldolase